MFLQTKIIEILEIFFAKLFTVGRKMMSIYVKSNCFQKKIAELSHIVYTFCIQNMKKIQA